VEEISVDRLHNRGAVNYMLADISRPHLFKFVDPLGAEIPVHDLGKKFTASH